MTESRIDVIDRHIIRCLQDDPRASYATIARLLGISQSTVKRRHEALLAERKIFHATMLDPSRLGFHSTAVLLLKVSPQHTLEVAEQLCTYDEVGYLIVTVGEFSILAYVIKEGVAEISAFITDHIAPLPGVQAVETILTPSFMKVFAGWRVSLGDNDVDAGLVEPDFSSD